MRERSRVRRARRGASRLRSSSPDRDGHQRMCVGLPTPGTAPPLSFSGAVADSSYRARSRPPHTLGCESQADRAVAIPGHEGVRRGPLRWWLCRCRKPQRLTRSSHTQRTAGLATGMLRRRPTAQSATARAVARRMAQANKETHDVQPCAKRAAHPSMIAPILHAHGVWRPTRRSCRTVVPQRSDRDRESRNSRTSAVRMLVSRRHTRRG